MAAARSESVCSLCSLVTEDGFEERWSHDRLLHGKESMGRTADEEDESVGKHRSCSVDALGQRRCAGSGAEQDSVGSRLHDSRRCTPCAFFHSKGCRSGANCLFCHKCTAQERGRRKRNARRMRGDLLSVVPSGHLHKSSPDSSMARAPRTAAAIIRVHDALQAEASKPLGTVLGAGSKTAAVQLPVLNASSSATCGEWLGAQRPPMLNCVPGSLHGAMTETCRATATVGQHLAPYRHHVCAVNIFPPHPHAYGSAVSVYCLVFGSDCASL